MPLTGHSTFSSSFSFTLLYQMKSLFLKSSHFFMEIPMETAHCLFSGNTLTLIWQSTTNGYQALH